MFEINPKMIEIYQQLPGWAKEDLKATAGPAWMDTGNSVLGWQWIPQVSGLKSDIGRTRDLPDKIPYLPTTYFDHVALLFHSHQVSFDLYEKESNFSSTAFLSFLDEEIKIESKSSDLLLSCIQLYQNSCKQYNKLFIPSLTKAEKVKNVFTDRNGQPAIDFEDSATAREFVKKYRRFALDQVHHERPNSLEQRYGRVRLLEGAYDIYAKYDQPKDLTTGFTISGIVYSDISYINFNGYYIWEPQKIKWKSK